MNVTVLGSGSWGTALAMLLARNSHNVTIAGRNKEELEILRSSRENFRYLPGFVLPAEVSYVELGEECQEPDLCVIAVPTHAVRETARRHSPTRGRIVVSSKGLESSTGLLMTQVFQEMRPDLETGILSGPNLAVEIAQGIPTVAIAAFESRESAELVQSAFNCRTLRVSVGDDLVGIELAGALKNVLAIGAGMSDGLGFGDNTKGAFLSRGLMEMARLGAAMGARPETFLGPAGAGDLFATANSRLSRNYRVGFALGGGSTLNQALQELGQVAEGVPTSEATQILSRRLGVDMPVFAAVEGVIRGQVTPAQSVAMLMDRSPKATDFLAPRRKEDL
jgi:glycerol-3-phosphate dehydrogenase (NAD(P)+)